MCRCVDFGSTNTSFLSARFIGGLLSASGKWKNSAHDTLPLDTCQRTRALAERGDFAPPHTVAETSRSPRILIFVLDTSPGSLLSCRQHSEVGEGGERVAKKKGAKKKKK